MQYRELGVQEVDFHHGVRDFDLPYSEAMAEVRREALAELKAAHAAGTKYLLYRHGSSTSHLGATTARSQIRGLMRSRDATPYIVRSESIQHDSVFVAAIRPTNSG